MNTTLTRRALGTAGFALAAPSLARAQGGPNRPITLVVPFPPGGLGDLSARALAPAMERALGVPVLVSNRAGGGGRVGTAAAARAAADGTTLLCTVSSLAVLPEADRILNRAPAYEVSDFVPLARVAADPVVLAVPASAPWRSAEDFVVAARAAPGAITYASTGHYGTAHLAMEMLAVAADLRLLHVPFQGAGPAVTALLSGTVASSAVAPGLAAAQDQRLRVLAAFGEERVPQFPAVPTLRERGLDAVYIIWSGLFAPAATPPETVARLRAAAATAVRDEGTARVLATAGTPVAFQDHAAFAAFLRDDTARVMPAVRRIEPAE